MPIKNFAHILVNSNDTVSFLLNYLFYKRIELLRQVIAPIQ